MFSRNVAFTFFQERPCIDLCCPFGEALVQGSDGEEECGSRKAENEFRTAQQLQAVVEKGTGLNLRAPSKIKKEFKCPKLLVPEWPHHFGEYTQESNGYKVKPDGSLMGEKVTYPYQHESRFGDTSWRNGEFCVAYADPKPTNGSDYDYDYESDGVFELVFGVCFQPVKEIDNSFTGNFHPYALGISVFFLILTIGIYVWFKGFALKDLNSRIYVAFIVNLTVTYSARC